MLGISRHFFVGWRKIGINVVPMKNGGDFDELAALSDI